MREQRARIQQFGAVDFFPLIRRRPRRIAFRRQGVTRRSEAEYVKQQRLAVTQPAILDETALRFPSMRHRLTAVEHPLPVHSGEQRMRERSNLALVRCVKRKIFCGRQHAGEQECSIHGRQLTLPHAAACLHVEEVVVEALVARRISFGPLRAIPEKTQTCERALNRVGARDESELDANRIGGEPKSGGGDARRCVAVGPVQYQAVGGIHFTDEVIKGLSLKRVQQLVGTCGTHSSLSSARLARSTLRRSLPDAVRGSGSVTMRISRGVL